MSNEGQAYVIFFLCKYETLELNQLKYEYETKESLFELVQLEHERNSN